MITVPCKESSIGGVYRATATSLLSDLILIESIELYIE
jgi:hypothetical protein